MERVELNTILLIVIIALIVFNPIVSKITKNAFKKRTNANRKLATTSKDVLAQRLTDAVRSLSKHKLGALITIERKDSLADYIKSGVILDANFSASLMMSIFEKSSPLHDGSVIISKGRVACSSAYFPSTRVDIDMKYGSRHRAAIGVSEIRDCFVIIVSETNGNVSIACNGGMHKYDISEFQSKVRSLLK